MNAEKYFGTRNLYAILGLGPSAKIQDGKHKIESKVYILITDVNLF